MINTFKKISYILDHQRKNLPFISIILLLNSLLDVIGISFLPIIISFIIEDQTSEISLFANLFDIKNENILEIFCLFLIIFFIFKSFVSFFIQKKILKYAYTVRTNIVIKIVNNYNKFNFELFIKKKSSDIILNSITHVGTFTDGVLIPLARSISEIFVLIGLFILISYQNIFVMLFLLILLVSIFFIYYFLIRLKLFFYGKMMSISEGSIIQNLTYVFEGFREVKLLNKNYFFTKSIFNDLKKYSNAGVNSRSILLIPRYLFEVSIVAFVLIIIYFSLRFNLIENNELISLLGFFVIAAIRIIPSLNTISQGISQIRSSIYAVEKLYDDLIIVNEKNYDEINYKNKISKFSFRKINFKNVSFKYKINKEFIFDSVNLEINKGEFIGLYGQSGAGKSTLVDLFLGLLEPSNGVIEITDMANNKTYNTGNNDLSFWHNNICYLPQQIFLIDDTVYNNITLGSDETKKTFNEIKYVLKKALLDNLYPDENDYLTKRIGEKGEYLSGGQKQRLSFARSIYSQRKILVLDEITSSLDKNTEKELFNFIYGLKGEYTIIMISHNLKILDNCDKLFEVKDKKVTKVK